MSQENVEMVESLFAAWNNGTLESVLPLVAEDIEWLEVEGRPDLEGGDFRGQVRVRSLLESLFDTWEVTLRGGKLARVHVYRDPQEALESVGLRE